MELREYQREAIDAVRREWQAHKDVLGIAPTGAGKTVIFISLILELFQEKPDARIVVIAHREELITQPVERLRMVDSEWLTTGLLEKPKVGLLMGDQKDYDRQLTIATVQTLSRESHLKKLLANGSIDYLITDEAHHAIAPAYTRVRDGLRKANPEMRHLGVTATPERGDGLAMANAFEKIAFRITIADLVRAGYLVKPTWLAISTQIDLSGVKTTAGDFQQSQLAERFDTAACRALVVAAHKEYAHDRPAIAFTTSVKGAHDLAQAFRDAGYTAASADGTTDKVERRKILADFRAGKFQVLVNCGLWTEGLDVPEIACIHLARPTRSDALYIQMVGRCLRPTPNKSDCLILDYLPAAARNVAMLGDILGCPIPREELLKQFSKQDKPGATQIGFTFDGDSFDANGVDMQIIAKELDYLKQSPWVWHRYDGLLTLGCGRGDDGIERILAIHDNQLYAIWRKSEMDAEGKWRPIGTWTARPIACADPFAKGEEFAAKHASSTLAAKGRSWHKKPVSDQQASYLKRLAGSALGRNAIMALNAVQAANLITHFQALHAIESISRLEVAA